MTKRQKLFTVILCLCSSLLTFVLTVTSMTALAAGVAFAWGDANGDGKISSTDLILLRRYLATYDYDTGKSDVQLGPKCTHEYTDTVIAPTCTEHGYTLHVCTLCGTSLSDCETPALGHEFAAAFTVDVEATRTSDGSKSRHCIRCDAATDVTVIPALGDDKLYFVESDGAILFGTYPQSRVDDAALNASLNAAAGTLPAAGAAAGWTPCDYSVNGTAADFMWFRDVELAGERYRGVYFTAYRPYWTDGASSAVTSWQDDNGYETGTVYWFRFEPIRWRKVANGDGAWLIISDLILDSREYSATGSNSYAESAVRAWLNDAFLNTAFTGAEKEIIRTATVPNSAHTANPDGNGNLWNGGANANTCEDTRDGLFLLSVQEVTARGYGFGAYSVTDAVRTKRVSSFAASLGAFVDDNGAGMWWLRSPDCDSAEKAHGIYSNGFADWVSSTGDAGCGIVPAMWLEY